MLEDTRYEFDNINHSNNQLKIETKDKINTINNMKVEIDILSEQIRCLNKDKKNLNCLIKLISNSSNELNRLVLECLGLYETISQTERDKIKLESNMLQLDLNKSVDDNSTLAEIRKEKEQIRQLLYDYDRRISNI